MYNAPVITKYIEEKCLPAGAGYLPFERTKTFGVICLKNSSYNK